ncbi:guanine nucleotide-binding protein G(I)/G(S)/G(O) subunit gamma-13-like [Carassius auratus]|uniref:Guanine nucleotide-binding protein G(I)/G(S)/G(O) subunit gamma-13-like n=1 Tax=Carassius auratus TaxID=7957 RepID=A0A6P6P3V7_CARAU|nr:guanine nucleotide-binding protein G(I)/G(S)/G(O) subunit gamma-13-like [Carassius auratus]XP_052443273.1 guanine nucleotide-binding protein G(I)/G(S)/G(O) subunit gamma-13-like [Carassius gibelio]
MLHNLKHSYSGYLLEDFKQSFHFTSKLLNSDLITMDELDETQLKNHVDSLKQQLKFNREKTSVSIPELIKWTEEKMNEDPFLNPDILKDNPWVESSKCVIT